MSSVYMFFYIYVTLIFDICEMDTIGFEVWFIWIAYLFAKFGTFQTVFRPETHHGAFMVLNMGLEVMSKCLGSSMLTLLTYFAM